MDMKSSNVEEVEQIEETDPKGKALSALTMIQESLWKLGTFLSDFLQDYVQEIPLTNFYGYVQDPKDFFVYHLIEEINFDHFLEGNVSLNMFIKIMEHIPRWSSHFEVCREAKTICNRCKKDLKYPSDELNHGMKIEAGSLRVLKAAFKDLTFETILKVNKIYSKMLCKKKRCGKRNYVDSVILKLPSIFTIALEWENNETEEEIFDTALILMTEIDITAIYKYEGDSTFTKYRLVSMVCLCGDVYNCVAYQRNSWVRYHLSSETEVIGDWESVLSMFQNLNVRPEILFYENAMQRDHMFTAQGSEGSGEDE